MLRYSSTNAGYAFELHFRISLTQFTRIFLKAHDTYVHINYVRIHIHIIWVFRPPPRTNIFTYIYMLCICLSTYVWAPLHVQAPNPWCVSCDYFRIIPRRRLAGWSRATVYYVNSNAYLYYVNSNRNRWLNAWNNNMFIFNAFAGPPGTFARKSIPTPRDCLVMTFRHTPSARPCATRRRVQICSVQAHLYIYIWAYVRACVQCVRANSGGTVSIKN